MQNEEEKYIKTLGEYMDWVDALRSEICLFRGLPNKAHSIKASAWRRLTNEQDSNNIDKLLEINEGLIRDARDQKFHIKDEGELRELEILAELQHFRAATFLIDFTYSALVALWFACQQRFKYPHNSKELSDGKVSVVFFNRDKIKKVDDDLLGQDISAFFDRETDGRAPLYLWEPTELNRRIPPQHSVFLFGADRIIEPNCVRFIEAEVKPTILDSIEGFSKTKESTLFPDFEGFIQERTQDRPYVPEGYERVKAVGYRAYQWGEYEKAISYFDDAIDLNPTDDVYYWRGDSKLNLDQIEDAIDDINEAINIKDNVPKYYYSLGIARFGLNQYDKSEKDFEKALELSNSDGEAELRNSIYHYLLEISNRKKQVNQWEPAQFQKLVPKDIKKLYDDRVGDEELYKLGADLQSLIQQRGWKLERRFGKWYFVFCYGRRRIFGVNLFSNPRLSIWGTEADESKFSDLDHKPTYYRPHKQWLFPKGIKVENIRDVLESFYNDTQINSQHTLFDDIE